MKKKFNDPCLQYGNPLSRIGGTSGKRLTVVNCPTDNQLVAFELLRFTALELLSYGYGLESSTFQPLLAFFFCRIDHELDHGLDHLQILSLPLWDVVQDLQSTDPTQDTCLDRAGYTQETCFARRTGNGLDKLDPSLPL